MPFFGFGNYAKPGPGVSKEVEEKPAAVRFFTVFQRRLSKFIQLNLIFMIPLTIILGLVFALFFFSTQHYLLEIKLSASILRILVWDMYVIPAPIALLAPFYGGMMVVARRLASEEYAFIWTEYWKGVKENWKQFLANGIFVYVMYVLLSFAFQYYSANLSAGFWSYIPFGIVVLVAVLLVFSQYYVSLMIVSVNLTLRQIYKNALIFSLMGLWRNLLLTLIFGVLAYLFLWLPSMMVLIALIALALVIIILFSFIAYTNCFIAYPLLQRYIIDPYEKKEERKSAPEVQPSTEDFTYLADELDNTADEKSAEYMYVNGKLVKRKDDDDGEEQIFQD